MITIGELAEKLNREEWAVERMLRNRGYLKKNGAPTKSCITSGYMNKNALITKAGESNFIAELGIKGSSNDEIDEENEDWDEDLEEENSEEDTGNDEDIVSELPEVCSCYRGWDIWVEKDDAHKFKITAVLEDDVEYEIDRITIYGDEIDEDTDVDTFVTDRIDEREDERAEARDWNENYPRYMGLDEDPDWEESYDFD